MCFTCLFCQSWSRTEALRGRAPSQPCALPLLRRLIVAQSGALVSGSMRPAKALSWLFCSEAAQEKKTDIYYFLRCGYGNQGRKSMLCFVQNCFLPERGRKGPRIKARLLDRLGPLLPPAFSPGTALFSPHHELASASFAVSKEVASIPRRPEGGRGGEGARL